MKKRKSRHRRKLHSGAVVRVTRFTPNGESFEYRAILHLETIPRNENDSVKCSLEPLPGDYYTRVKEARDYFASLQINRDWWKISNHCVELSRHTQIGKTMTAQIMESLGYRNNGIEAAS